MSALLFQVVDRSVGENVVNFAQFGAVIKSGNLVDLQKYCKVSVSLQKSVSIQPKTSPRNTYLHVCSSPDLEIEISCVEFRLCRPDMTCALNPSEAPPREILPACPPLQQTSILQAPLRCRLRTVSGSKWTCLLTSQRRRRPCT